MKKMLVLSTFSLALMSGAAFAQVDAVNNTGVSGSAGFDAQEVGEAVENAANEVGQAIEDAANAVGSELEKSANSGPSDDPNSTGALSEGLQDEVDVNATASINASSRLGASLDAIGADADAFFTDGTRTSVVGQEEFSATFERLTPEQQADLRSSCQDADSGLSASFCAAVSAL